MSEGYSSMDEAAQDSKDSHTDINPWREYFISKKARGFVLMWCVFLYVAAHFGLFTTPAEALSFGFGALAMFSAWTADMKNN